MAGTTSDGSQVAKFGPEKVLQFDDMAATDFIADYIAQLLGKEGVDYVFIGSTVTGRDVAGLLSGKTGLRALGEISAFSIENGKARTRRFSFGGKSVLEEESDAKIFTVAPGISEPSTVGQESPVENVHVSGSRIKKVSEQDKSAGGVDLEKAQIIVSVGRGLGKQDGVAVAEGLAHATNGVVAGSRPVCLDYHWLSEDRQVGLSGKKVRPKVYIALGISGQIQHIAGMRGSKIVVAINKDKTAPIFEECDYGIVGDLYQIVPKLVEELKK
jgi:electron transfer flavoprotein alpha subunit